MDAHALKLDYFSLNDSKEISRSSVIKGSLQGKQELLIYT